MSYSTDNNNMSLGSSLDLECSEVEKELLKLRYQLDNIIALDYQSIRGITTEKHTNLSSEELGKQLLNDPKVLSVLWKDHPQQQLHVLQFLLQLMHKGYDPDTSFVAAQLGGPVTFSNIGQHTGPIIHNTITKLPGEISTTYFVNKGSTYPDLILEEQYNFKPNVFGNPGNSHKKNKGGGGNNGGGNNGGGNSGNSGNNNKTSKKNKRDNNNKDGSNKTQQKQQPQIIFKTIAIYRYVDGENKWYKTDDKHNALVDVNGVYITATLQELEQKYGKHPHNKENIEKIKNMAKNTNNNSGSIGSPQQQSYQAPSYTQYPTSTSYDQYQQQQQQQQQRPQQSQQQQQQQQQSQQQRPQQSQQPQQQQQRQAINATIIDPTNNINTNIKFFKYNNLPPNVILAPPTNIHKLVPPLPTGSYKVTINNSIDQVYILKNQRNGGPNIWTYKLGNVYYEYLKSKNVNRFFWINKTTRGTIDNENHPTPFGSVKISSKTPIFRKQRSASIKKY